MSATGHIQKRNYLVFALGNEPFGIDVQHVIEVIPNQKCTEIPNAPDYIMGVINFRGDLLPVINTYSRLNITQTQAKKPVIIVLELHTTDATCFVGFTASSVQTVVETNTLEIKDMPDFGRKYNNELLDGAIKFNDEFVVLLNPEKIFREEELNEINNRK
ncbi:MAG: chemotaxis protein CheW [Bacteroidales bacterium]|nr:chemotaxis protein CheW [Bacteroidales bacterium]